MWYSDVFNKNNKYSQLAQMELAEPLVAPEMGAPTDSITNPGGYFRTEELNKLIPQLMTEEKRTKYWKSEPILQNQEIPIGKFYYNLYINDPNKLVFATINSFNTGSEWFTGIKKREEEKIEIPRPKAFENDTKTSHFPYHLTQMLGKIDFDYFKNKIIEYVSSPDFVKITNNDDNLQGDQLQYRIINDAIGFVLGGVKRNDLVEIIQNYSPYNKEENETLKMFNSYLLNASVPDFAIESLKLLTEDFWGLFPHTLRDNSFNPKINNALDKMDVSTIMTIFMGNNSMRCGIHLTALRAFVLNDKNIKRIVDDILLNPQNYAEYSQVATFLASIANYFSYEELLSILLIKYKEGPGNGRLVSRDKLVANSYFNMIANVGPPKENREEFLADRMERVITNPEKLLEKTLSTIERHKHKPKEEYFGREQVLNLSDIKKSTPQGTYFIGWEGAIIIAEALGSLVNLNGYSNEQVIGILSDINRKESNISQYSDKNPALFYKKLIRSCILARDDNSEEYTNIKIEAIYDMLQEHGVTADIPIEDLFNPMDLDQINHYLKSLNIKIPFLKVVKCQGDIESINEVGFITPNQNKSQSDKATGKRDIKDPRAFAQDFRTSNFLSNYAYQRIMRKRSEEGFAEEDIFNIVEINLLLGNRNLPDLIQQYKYINEDAQFSLDMANNQPPKNLFEALCKIFKIYTLKEWSVIGPNQTKYPVQVERRTRKQHIVGENMPSYIQSKSYGAWYKFALQNIK